ncbi:putative nucleoporin Nsp1 [Aspergillus puulaauensis]|uniref:Nucleoporin NSP1 n=1 Tax=Aspergillus puulaauensis TaxID=1220207 RepID=A0A7R7XY85_9EURO|nr:FG-nucleoporin nsp1 [Aspergillus puulaauensis]BCS29128.1 FG-nucleoporin nsp1 [Aspergillus puulaauensis]
MSNLFSFKPPASSGAPSGGMFGSAGATSNTGSSGGGLFGNVGTSGTSSPSFGATSGPGQISSPFGAGSGSGSGAPTFSFGNSAAGATSGTQSPSLFATGSQTPNKPTETPAPGSTAPGGLFGGASKPAGSGLFGTAAATPASSGTGSLFGAQSSTTPAGPPPQGNTPAQGQSLFGQQKPGGLFGTATTSSGSQPSSTAPSTSTPPLFGGAGQSTGSSLLKPTTQQTPGGAPSSTAAGGGLFGNMGASKPAESTATTTSADSTAKPLFGTAPSSGTQTSTLFAPASSGADSAPKPAFPSLNNTSNTQTAASTATPQKPLFSLGGPASSATPSSTPAAAPSGGLFGGLGASKPAETSTTQPAAPTGGLFNKLAETTTTQPPSTSATTTTTGTDTKPSLTATSGTTTTSTPATTTGLGSTTATGAPALGASTAGPVPPAQSRLKNKTMDEIITRWATDLTKYQKDFREQAEKVAEWDRMLVENGTKVQKLYGSTVDAERATQEVERQLASVEGQQDELTSWLDRYEREVDEMMSKQVGPGEALQGPDQERERTYKLAEKLSERLDDMGKDLTSMIEEVNSASSTLSKTNKADEPISQIVRILNSHLSQLQTIDVGTTELQDKVAAAQKAGQSVSARFGHGYSMSGVGNGSAADDFYRSYMGRR